MTHVNFLVNRLSIGETQTDRQTRQICNRYIYISELYILIFIALTYKKV